MTERDQLFAVKRLARSGDKSTLRRIVNDPEDAYLLGFTSVRALALADVHLANMSARPQGRLRGGRFIVTQ